MSVTDGIGQTPCSFEHYLVSLKNFIRGQAYRKSSNIGLSPQLKLEIVTSVARLVL